MNFILSTISWNKNSKFKSNKILKCSIENENVEKFSQYIDGIWSNSEQAEECPALWSNINVSYKKLPFDILGGVSFYVESAYNYMLDRPYKTGVVLLKPKDEMIEMKNFRIIQPEDFWYGSYNNELLAEMSSERLIELPEFCNTVFTYCEKQDSFSGKTSPGKKCVIPRNGKKTYLDSRISLSKNRYSSWDIGRDLDTDEQVWGATSGAFRFKKI